MSVELNVIDFEKARALKLSANNKLKSSPRVTDAVEITKSSFAQRIARIHNRIFRWNASAFDLSFGPNLLKLDNPQYVLQLLSQLNRQSYKKLAPNPSNRVMDQSSGLFSFHGFIHEWEIVLTKNQLGQEKRQIFIEIFSSEVFSRSDTDLLARSR